MIVKAEAPRGDRVDEETAHAILTVQADTIALRSAMKVLLRRVYGMGDQALGVIREDALAAVEIALRDNEADEQQRFFHQAVRDAITDLLTPLPR
jgi:hypothetical protein